MKKDVQRPPLIKVKLTCTEMRQFYDSKWDVEINIADTKCSASDITRRDTETENDFRKVIYDLLEQKLHIFSQIEKTWCKETAHPAYQDKWSPENPSCGQCYITAQVIYDFYGGQIAKMKVGRNSHYFNILPNDLIIDLTSPQFGKDIDYSKYSICKSGFTSSEAYNRYQQILKEIVLDKNAITDKDLLGLDEKSTIYYD